MKKQQEQEEWIVVRDVPPKRIERLESELHQQRIPYQIDQGQRGQYDISTHKAALPIFQRILGKTEQWDVFSRKPENRSRLDDGLGFVLSLIALGVIISQSEMIAGWAGEAGINGDVARGVGILVIGAVVTYVWSEIFMHHDQRRSLFRTPMLLLFGCAAAWFILTGMGWDMAGELARLMP